MLKLKDSPRFNLFVQRKKYVGFKYLSSMPVISGTTTIKYIPRYFNSVSFFTFLSPLTQGPHSSPMHCSPIPKIPSMHRPKPRRMIHAEGFANLVKRIVCYIICRASVHSLTMPVTSDDQPRLASKSFESMAFTRPTRDKVFMFSRFLLPARSRYPTHGQRPS